MSPEQYKQVARLERIAADPGISKTETEKIITEMNTLTRNAIGESKLNFKQAPFCDRMKELESIYQLHKQ